MTSAISDNKTMDIQARSSVATAKLREALGLETLKASDLKYLATALAETATEEIKRNPDFATHLRAILCELMPPKQEIKKAPPKNKKKSPLDDLIPIKVIDMSRFNPYASPDPYLLREAFGDKQLPKALETFTLPTLRDIATEIETKNPGSKPQNKNKKASIVEYIVQIVTT